MASRQASKNFGRKHGVCNNQDKSSAREMSQENPEEDDTAVEQEILPGSVQISTTCKSLDHHYYTDELH